jgi:hypothetical protein
MTTPIDSQVAKLREMIDKAATDIEILQLENAYPSMTPDVKKLLDRFGLSAAAAKAPISAKEFDTALATSSLSAVRRMAIKLKLREIGVLR